MKWTLLYIYILEFKANYLLKRKPINIFKLKTNGSFKQTIFRPFTLKKYQWVY